MTPSIVALIPARAGSKRVPGKNTRLLAGCPLVEWTIDAAKASDVFERIIVCSDDTYCRQIAEANSVRYFIRNAVPDTQPDIEWIRDVIEQTPPFDAFAILRPTSPFRTAATIRRAWAQFQRRQPCDSIRAVERPRQHPYKMWRLIHDYLYPWQPVYQGGVPAHSCPSQSLPAVYVQNASLEIAWAGTVTRLHSISGTTIAPFFTEGLEGFDINTEDDWREAERLAAMLVTHG